MSETKLKEYTLDEIAKHNTEEDCWMIVGNFSNGGPKVYDVSKYLDDHPGGAEVMLDVAGRDADEFFEDIGHSNDARNELKKHLIGDYKMDDAALAKKKEDAEKQAANKNASGGMSIIMILVILIGVAFGYYKTQM